MDQNCKVVYIRGERRSTQINYSTTQPLLIKCLLQRNGNTKKNNSMCFNDCKPTDDNSNSFTNKTEAKKPNRDSSFDINISAMRNYTYFKEQITNLLKNRSKTTKQNNDDECNKKPLNDCCSVNKEVSKREHNDHDDNFCGVNISINMACKLNRKNNHIPLKDDCKICSGKHRGSFMEVYDDNTNNESTKYNCYESTYTTLDEYSEYDEDYDKNNPSDACESTEKINGIQESDNSENMLSIITKKVDQLAEMLTALQQDVNERICGCNSQSIEIESIEEEASESEWESYTDYIIKGPKKDDNEDNGNIGGPQVTGINEVSCEGSQLDMNEELNGSNKEEVVDRKEESVKQDEDKSTNNKSELNKNVEKHNVQSISISSENKLFARKERSDENEMNGKENNNTKINNYTKQKKKDSEYMEEKTSNRVSTSGGHKLFARRKSIDENKMDEKGNNHIAINVEEEHKSINTNNKNSNDNKETEDGNNKKYVSNYNMVQTIAENKSNTSMFKENETTKHASTSTDFKKYKSKKMKTLRVTTLKEDQNKFDPKNNKNKNIKNHNLNVVHFDTVATSNILKDTRKSGNNKNMSNKKNTETIYEITDAMNYEMHNNNNIAEPGCSLQNRSSYIILRNVNKKDTFMNELKEICEFKDIKRSKIYSEIPKPVKINRNDLIVNSRTHDLNSMLISSTPFYKSTKQTNVKSKKSILKSYKRMDDHSSSERLLEVTDFVSNSNLATMELINVFNPIRHAYHKVFLFLNWCYESYLSMLRNFLYNYFDISIVTNLFNPPFINENEPTQSNSSFTILMEPNTTKRLKKNNNLYSSFNILSKRNKKESYLEHTKCCRSLCHYSHSHQVNIDMKNIFCTIELWITFLFKTVKMYLFLIICVVFKILFCDLNKNFYNLKIMEFDYSAVADVNIYMCSDSFIKLLGLEQLLQNLVHTFFVIRNKHRSGLDTLNPPWIARFPLVG